MDFYHTPPQNYNLNSAYRMVNNDNSYERFFPTRNMTNNTPVNRSPCTPPHLRIASPPTPPTVIRRRESVSSVTSSMSSHSESEENEALSPLSTNRLKPITQRVRSMTMSITECGIVCLEFHKVKNGVMNTIETFSVSQDGNVITITNLRQQKHGDESNRTKIFQLENLPQCYHKKYNHARKFVALVQSKTPKVTMYNKEAKCMLMENYPSPNFEVHFYSGRKFISNWSGMKLVDDEQGSILSLSTPRIQQQFSNEIQQLIKQAEKYHQQCIQFEAVIQSTANSCTDRNELFPVIIGKRPESRIIVNEEPVLPTSHPADVSIMTTSTTSSSSSSSCSTDTCSHVIRQIRVPTIGLASQLDNGDIWVEFEDGSHLGIKPTVTTVTYINQIGLMKKYKKSEPLPDNVKVKLASLPVVLEQLKHSQKTESFCHFSE
ncbi:hypothetical protein SNE40_016620 [Patella caerulea]|uniref:Uncharacterized protein n=1 Tax=Patella caerulea TaxID=87958 RepID=A0AAN8JC81_PATCE